MGVKEAFFLTIAGMIITILWVLADIIGTWRVFRKAGESGWKALIPFYSNYTAYKMSWHVSMFWLNVGLLLINFVCGNLIHANVITIMSSLLMLGTIGIHIQQKYRLAVCFQKGVGFTLGLIFLKPVFLLILAFDRSTYTYVKTDNRIIHEMQENLIVQTEKYREKLKKSSDEKEAEDRVKEEIKKEATDSVKNGTKEAKGGTKKFAQGFCFKKIFIFFVIGCLIGTYWEETLYFFTNHFQTTNRQGMLYGPFSPIYGVGISIFVLLLGKNNDKHTILKTYLYSCLIGGFAEYMTSLIAEKCFGVTFWDYHDLFLNINGRTTIPYMLFWGLGGLVLMKVGYPLISKWLEKIPLRWGTIIFYIFFVLFMIDFILTYSAFGRMALRDQGVKPYTFYGEFLDEAYPDEYMAEKFPVMTNPE